MEHNGTAVGFALFFNPAPDVLARGEAALNRCLRHFPWINLLRYECGDYRLWVWGHGQMNSALFRGEQEVWLLVGTPLEATSAEVVAQNYVRDHEGFVAPDGRCAVMCVAARSASAMFWTDWAGGLPIFYGCRDRSLVVTSLEPLSAAALNLSEADLSPRGVYDMLTFGHHLGTGTLFRGQSKLHPDSMTVFNKTEVGGTRQLWTVRPSDRYWGCGWRELTAAMRQHVGMAVGRCWRDGEPQVLALSGGLDSRVIACLASEARQPLFVYTYGNGRADDVVYARALAGKLGLSCQVVAIDPGFMSRHGATCLDLFGGSMLLHGAYQFPFLETARGKGTILSGFMGDPLAGKQVGGLATLYAKKRSLRGVLIEKTCLGRPDDCGDLFAGDVRAMQREQEDVLAAELDLIPGALWQRLWYLFVWSHVATFTAYHPTLYDYHNAERSPFLDRAYANFCQGLPLACLEDRRLQIEMLSEYWPAAVSVPSTAFLQPIRRTIWHEVWQRVVWRFPSVAAPKRFRVSHSWPMDMQYGALERDGIRALPPFDRDVVVPDLLRDGAVRERVSASCLGNREAYAVVPGIQAIVHAVNRAG
jgi:hypothetical protein